MRVIRITMLQLNNYFSDQETGYTKAASMIMEASKEGIDLAVLPELSGCGYIPNQSIWKFAEPIDGKTARWACDLSAQLGIYIGAGFIETDGRDFYNSYLLSSPEGNICGVIRKEDAESYCFKRSGGNIYLDTGIGRIGIGICADNHYMDRLKRMKDVNIDFMLMPHASPAPFRTNARISGKDIELFEKQPEMIASVYSKYLRRPTVFVNSVGSFPEFAGGYFVKDFNENFRLMGGSLVTGSDGVPKTRMGSAESYAVVEVSLEPSDDRPVEPIVYHKRWLHPGNAVFRGIVMPLVTRKGIRNYEKNSKKWMSLVREAEECHG